MGATVFSPGSVVVGMVAWRAGSEGGRREGCLVTNFKTQQNVSLAQTVEETVGHTE